MAKKKKKKQQQQGAGFERPPFMSFDPALEAERRALGRGLADLRVDTRIARRRSRRDTRTRVQDLGLTKGRGMSDLSRELSRGLEKIGFERQDIETTAGRGREDFGTRLTNMIRGYQTLGSQQMQSANAAGVLGGSTERAAAARRASNLAIERQPIDTGLSRLEEDRARSLGRLGVAQTQLGQDVGRGRLRLTQDVAHDIGLARLGHRRTKADLFNKLQRGIREQRIGDIDLTQQEIYQARELHPGTFTKYGRKKKGKGRNL